MCVVRFLIKSLHSSLKCLSATKAKRLFFPLWVFISIFIFAVYKPQESKRLGPQQQFRQISENSARNAKHHSCFTSRHCRGVKVLVGTPVTCLKGDDEKTWGSSLGKNSNNFSIFQELEIFQVRLDEGVPCHGGA